MTSSVPVSPSLFISDDESDRSSKRSFHDSFSIGQPELDSTTNTHSTGSVTPRKRHRGSKSPDYDLSSSEKEDLPDETVDLSPITTFSPEVPSVTTHIEEGRLSTGMANARLSDFTDMQRAYMIAGARDFSVEAENRQQEIANDEGKERENLQYVLDAYEYLLKETRTTYHEFLQKFELLDHDHLKAVFGDPGMSNALAFHYKVVHKARAIQKSMGALMRALNDVSSAAEQIKIDQAAAWDLRRAEAAREVEMHRVNLQMLEQGLWDSS